MLQKYIVIIIATIGLIGVILFFPKEKNTSNESDKIVGKELMNTNTVTPEASSSPTNSGGATSPSKNTFNVNKKYTAVLKTPIGDITIELHAESTPKTVENFVTLARKNFYNNTVFHRVIKGFMIQGGDPNGDGTGGPGYKFDDEPFTGEYTRGTVAMANAGPNTNGSQFFIMHQDYALPKNYVIFGNVISGMDTVDKIAQSPVGKSRSGESSEPITPITVTSVTIQEE